MLGWIDAKSHNEFDLNALSILNIYCKLSDLVDLFKFFSLLLGVVL